MNNLPQRVPVLCGHLRASTLAELLVVMVVAGIVLVSVLDGLGLFNRVASSMADRIGQSADFRESYHRLEHLVSSADSLTELEGRITAWRGGESAAVLYQRDSLLLALFARQTDTLFSGVISLAALPREDRTGLDSIILQLIRNEGPMRIALPVIVPEYIQAQQTIEQTESGYVYQ